MEKLRVVAIISAFNEADIIQPVLEHLIREGLSVYLLDHGSTDGTVGVAQKFLGRGLLTIEPFPRAESGADRDMFAWAPILRRKVELSQQLDADWFIHHDADEFRESPWEGMRLVDAIRRVDRLGYNAIDFELFDFWPTDDGFQPGDDPTTAFRFYEPGRPWNKLQIKCWKRQPLAPDLLRTGGHDAFFPDRRVFPLRFILRHYPIRGTAHGLRKVFQERVARFVPEEIAAGWHFQYNELVETQRFIRAPETLTVYDADAIRIALTLRHRLVEELEAGIETREHTIANLRGEALNQEHTIANLRGEAVRASEQMQEQSAQIGRLTDAVTQSEVELGVRDNHLQAQAVEINRLTSEAKRLASDIEGLQREIATLYASRTWRSTAWARALYRALMMRD